MKKFYKTILTFAVLSEDKPVSTGSLSDIAAVVEACDTGDCVGMMLKEEAIELTAAEAAEALTAFGSEPGFFRLDAEEISDAEQADRNKRTDLCATCRPKHHDCCGNDASCPCCRDAHERGSQ